MELPNRSGEREQSFVMMRIYNLDEVIGLDPRLLPLRHKVGQPMLFDLSCTTTYVNVLLISIHQHSKRFYLLAQNTDIYLMLISSKAEMA